MRRFRTALLIPALAAVGGVVAMPHSAPVAAAASSHAVAWCVEDPVSGAGCLPVPCPSKLPFPCPQVALAPAMALEL
jgi:hypothetical protein